MPWRRPPPRLRWAAQQALLPRRAVEGCRGRQGGERWAEVAAPVPARISPQRRRLAACGLVAVGTGERALPPSPPPTRRQHRTLCDSLLTLAPPSIPPPHTCGGSCASSRAAGEQRIWPEGKNTPRYQSVGGSRDRTIGSRRCGWRAPSVRGERLAPIPLSNGKARPGLGADSGSWTIDLL